MKAFQQDFFITRIPGKRIVNFKNKTRDIVFKTLTRSAWLDIRLIKKIGRLK